jgi:hypothetical protein
MTSGRCSSVARAALLGYAPGIEKAGILGFKPAGGLGQPAAAQVVGLWPATWVRIGSESLAIDTEVPGTQYAIPRAMEVPGTPYAIGLARWSMDAGMSSIEVKAMWPLA